MRLLHMTGTYVSALAFLAILALVDYYLPRAELKRQQSSAAVLNLTGRQHMLLERTAMLAELLVFAEDEPTREQCRRHLRDDLEQMETTHHILLHGDASANIPPAPPSVRAMHLEPPLRVDRQLQRYFAETRELLAHPAAELTGDAPNLRYILTEASGTLAESLAALSVERQRLDELSVRHLRRWHALALAGTLTVLVLLGVAVFRPLVRRVQREHEERLRSERLAVIGSMAAKFAHEIRNPLGSIRLNLDSVQEALAGPTRTLVPALLHSIDSEVRRIHRISDGYLQFARLPKGHRQPLALNEWLAQQLRICAAELAQRRIQLRTEFAPGLPAVRADAGQLWQAVLNILRNAWEAMPDGGTLMVRTARTQRHVQLAITDTGPGMTEEHRRVVFQPFVTAKEGGIGLGLALTQQIITEHDGQITCASQPGTGTTFTIHLPVAKEIKDEKQTHHSAD